VDSAIVVPSRAAGANLSLEASIVRRRDPSVGGIRSALGLLLAVLLGGCGTFSGALSLDAALTAGLRAADVAPPAPEAVVVPSPEPEPSTTPVTTIDVDFAPRLTASVVDAEGETPAGDAGRPWWLAATAEDLDGAAALAQDSRQESDAFEEEYDPWESFNEKTFAFNRNLDRFVLKPAARAYMFIMPEPWQVLIANGFDNISFVPRFVNSLLQGKWSGAGRELGRFLINSTAGIGGLFDPAKDFWGIQKSREDFGQTLGVWGSGPGPYLIVPFLEPLTVRDGIGKLVDSFMDPLSYVLPLIWTRVGMKGGEILNDRALNYELFQGFEESVIDMYSAVRHGYLQRRQQLIKE
jgi:phospholipid-binding lipoprotein MlaA